MACILFLPQTSHTGRNWMALIHVQNSSSKRLGIDICSAANKVQKSSYKESSPKDKQAARSHLMLPLHYHAAWKRKPRKSKSSTKHTKVHPLPGKWIHLLFISCLQSTDFLFIIPYVHQSMGQIPKAQLCTGTKTVVRHIHIISKYLSEDSLLNWWLQISLPGGHFFKNNTEISYETSTKGEKQAKSSICMELTLPCELTSISSLNTCIISSLLAWFLYLFCSARDGNQGLTHTRQML